MKANKKQKPFTTHMFIQPLRWIETPPYINYEITYTFNNLIEFKPNFYNIKNSTNNNIIKPFLEIICLWLKKVSPTLTSRFCEIDDFLRWNLSLGSSRYSSLPLFSTTLVFL